MIPINRLVRPRPPIASDQDPILLVIPPSIFLLDERVFVSLGILKVAASLEKAGYRVEVLDLSGISNYEEVTEIAVKNSRAKNIGITITTPQLPAATKIVSAIRKAGFTGRIIGGGPHPTLVHSAVKLEQKSGRVGRAHQSLKRLEQIFDILVSGDGEHAIFEALKPGASKIIDADLPGQGLFMDNPMYEDTPIPARHLIDMSSYKYEIEGFPATSLIAQLGCPFACNFAGAVTAKCYVRPEIGLQFQS